MTSRVAEREIAERSGASTVVAAGMRSAPGGRGVIRLCDACGARMVVAETAQPAALGWGVIRFCDACAHGLPAAEAERLAGEWALRGVPLS